MSSVGCSLLTAQDLGLLVFMRQRDVLGQAHLVDVVLIENSAVGLLSGRERLKNVVVCDVGAVGRLVNLGCLPASAGGVLLLSASNIEDAVADLTLEHSLAHLLLSDALTVFAFVQP